MYRSATAHSEKQNLNMAIPDAAFSAVWCFRGCSRNGRPLIALRRLLLVLVSTPPLTCNLYIVGLLLHGTSSTSLHGYS